MRLAAAVLLAAVASAATPVTVRYVGTTSSRGLVSFSVANGVVSAFTFQSRCPGLAVGTPVSAPMKVVGGRFSYRDAQFTISGSLPATGPATGTARDVTGDCDSGVLRWTAHESTRTVAAPAADKKAIVAAFGDPPAAARCLDAGLAASDRSYASVAFRAADPSCTRWGFDGVNVLRRVSATRWRVVFEGSAYPCPVAHVPRAVQRDLGVCPLSRR